MSFVRIAVHMQSARAEDGTRVFKAALPMGAFFVQGLDKQEIETARGELENAYAELIVQLRAARAAMRGNNVIAYWQFGDALVAFEDAHQAGLLFVEQLTIHLVRDVEFSETMILLCRRFRETFPDSSKIDPNQSFTNYHRAGFDPARLSPTIRRRGRPRKK